MELRTKELIIVCTAALVLLKRSRGGSTSTAANSPSRIFNLKCKDRIKFFEKEWAPIRRWTWTSKLCCKTGLYSISFTLESRQVICGRERQPHDINPQLIINLLTNIIEGLEAEFQDFPCDIIFKGHIAATSLHKFRSEDLSDAVATWTSGFGWIFFPFAPIHISK